MVNRNRGDRLPLDSKAGSDSTVEAHRVELLRGGVGKEERS
jgi:hypothetical protein